MVEKLPLKNALKTKVYGKLSTLNQEMNGIHVAQVKIME
jgi:hypothetical protein